MKKKIPSEAHYLDLIFQGKNKKYGAYQIRKTYLRRLILIAFSILAFMGLAFTLLKYQLDLKPISSEEHVVREVNLNAPPVAKEAIQKPVLIPKPVKSKKVARAKIPSKPLKTQVKHTVPKIQKDNFVKKEDRPKPISAIDTANVGLTNVSGKEKDTASAVSTATGDTTAANLEPKSDFKKSENKQDRYISKLPSFKGDLNQYLRKHLVYPDAAREQGVMAVVPVQFIVEADGSISNIRILKSPGAGLGSEVKRIIRKMPKWSPAEKGGKPIRACITKNVKFHLLK